MNKPGALSQPLTATQLRVLYAVKAGGETNIPALASRVALTDTGVRQHISVLEAAGLVVARAEPNHRPGRNRYLYHATADADAIFADRSPVHLTALVNFLAGAHPDVLATWVEEWMNGVRDENVAAMQGSTFPERLSHVADRATLRGVILSVEEATDTGGVARIHHCPMLTLARAAPLVCELERRNLEARFPGFAINRETWKVEGEPYCQYRATPVAG